MTDPGRKNLRLPTDVAERIEEVAEKRSMNENELVAEVLENALGVDEDTEVYLRRRLDEIENEEKQLRKEVRSRGSQLQKIQQEKREVIERIERIKEERKTLDEVLNSILEDMVENKRKNVDAYKSNIVEAIRIKYDTTPTEAKREEIIADLRNQASAREDISIKPARFAPGGNTSQQSKGITDGGRETELRSKQKFTQGDTDGR